MKKNAQKPILQWIASSFLSLILGVFIFEAQVAPLIAELNILVQSNRYLSLKIKNLKQQHSSLKFWTEPELYHWLFANQARFGVHLVEMSAEVDQINLSLLGESQNLRAVLRDLAASSLQFMLWQRQEHSVNWQLQLRLDHVSVQEESLQFNRKMIGEVWVHQQNYCVEQEGKHIKMVKKVRAC